MTGPRSSQSVNNGFPIISVCHLHKTMHNLVHHQLAMISLQMCSEWLLRRHLSPSAQTISSSNPPSLSAELCWQPSLLNSAEQKSSLVWPRKQMIGTCAELLDLVLCCFAVLSSLQNTVLCTEREKKSWSDWKVLRRRVWYNFGRLSWAPPLPRALVHH